jgi:hypothetical protein
MIIVRQLTTKQERLQKIQEMKAEIMEYASHVEPPNVLRGLSDELDLRIYEFETDYSSWFSTEPHFTRNLKLYKEHFEVHLKNIEHKRRMADYEKRNRAHKERMRAMGKDV